MKHLTAYLKAWVILIGLLPLGLTGCGEAETPAARKEPAPQTIAMEQLLKPGPLPENIKGAEAAPVTIIEYSSMTCPHCAAFHKETLPILRSEYIDKGKVRYILREYPLDNLAAAAAMIARCAGKEKFFAFVDALYATQQKWAGRGANPREELFKLAQQVGFTKQKFDDCLNDQKLLDGLSEIRQRASKEYGVRSTPTFFINGKKLEGARPIEDFEKLMAADIKITRTQDKQGDKNDERVTQ